MINRFRESRWWGSRVKPRTSFQLFLAAGRQGSLVSRDRLLRDEK